MEVELHGLPASGRFVAHGKCCVPLGRDGSPALAISAGEAPVGTQGVGHKQYHSGSQGLILKTTTVVNTSIIASPRSAKNKDGERDPDEHKTPRRAIGSTSAIRRIPSSAGASNVNAATQTVKLLHSERSGPRSDSGYKDVTMREELKDTAKCAEKFPCDPSSAERCPASENCIRRWRRPRSSRPAYVPKSNAGFLSSSSSSAKPRSVNVDCPRTGCA